MSDFWLGVICAILFLLICVDAVLVGILIKIIKESKEMDEQIKELFDNKPNDEKYRMEDGLLSGKRKA